MVLAGVHGNEHAGLLAVPDILDAFLAAALPIELRVVTPVNPVGPAHLSRYNANGFDINRDFVPFETPEARSLRRVFDEMRPDFVVSLHEGPQDAAFMFTNRRVPAPLAARLLRAMKDAGVAVAVGRYDEARGIYLSGLFGAGERPTDERRTVHLGIDLFVDPGSPIHAPLEGVVHILANNTAPLDYGPLVVLRHETNTGGPFFTLYGHLTEDTLDGLRLDQKIPRGEEFARVGAPPTNGGWTPHLHFQIILDLLERGADFPGVAHASRRAVWTSLSPDPNVLLGIPPDRFPAAEDPPSATLSARRDRLGPSLGVSYRTPLKIVRGWRQYLYDETGRAYLDVYNNVPLVGHSHPRVRSEEHTSELQSH